MEMFKFLGAMIGFGIMCKSPIPFNFAPTVWKQLLNEELTLDDLETIDAYSQQVLKDLKMHSSILPEEDFNESVHETFTTVLSNGD